MTRALATLLFLSIAAPAHASYSLERPKTRVGGVTRNSAQAPCFVWLQEAETRRLIGVLAYDCASGQPVNLYAYAAFDPIDLNDPFGLDSQGPAKRKPGSPIRWPVGLVNPDLSKRVYPAFPDAADLAGGGTVAATEVLVGMQAGGMAHRGAVAATNPGAWARFTGWLKGLFKRKAPAPVPGGKPATPTPEPEKPPSEPTKPPFEPSPRPACTGPSCICFVAGTLVLMADGSTKAIEVVEVGELVLAADPENSSGAVVRRVVATHQTLAARIVHVVLAGAAGDAEIQSTGQHPFWVAGVGWRHAADLVAGDRLLDADQKEVEVVAVFSESRDETTYNLSVEGLHTYYVVAGGRSMLVHNIDPFDIKFSQPNIDPVFNQGPWAGRTLQEAIAETQRIGALPEGLTLEVTIVGHDYVTLDNRTLYVAQKANLSQVHPEILGPEATNKLDRLFREGSGGPVDQVQVRCP